MQGSQAGICQCRMLLESSVHYSGYQGDFLSLCKRLCLMFVLTLAPGQPSPNSSVITVCNVRLGLHCRTLMRSRKRGQLPATKQLLGHSETYTDSVKRCRSVWLQECMTSPEGLFAMTPVVTILQRPLASLLYHVNRRSRAQSTFVSKSCTHISFSVML